MPDYQPNRRRVLVGQERHLLPPARPWVAQASSLRRGAKAPLSVGL